MITRHLDIRRRGKLCLYIAKLNVHLDSHQITTKAKIITTMKTLKVEFTL